jgi:hypothetical protein
VISWGTIAYGTALTGLAAAAALVLGCVNDEAASS